MTEEVQPTPRRTAVEVGGWLSAVGWLFAIPVGLGASAAIAVETYHHNDIWAFVAVGLLAAGGVVRFIGRRL